MISRKHKQSFFLVEEAEEIKENERKKLRLAVISLYLQAMQIQEIILVVNVKNNWAILDRSASRLSSTKYDLFEYYQNGNFISGVTT